MMDTSNRTFVSSVLFLDIVEYSKQSVTDQLALKKRFNDLLVDALKHVVPGDRIVLDTGDGAAISFQGNPEDSLFAAMHLRDSVATDIDGARPLLQVRFGINLGPVRLIKDINGQLNIIGDGINVAQRVMSFADPGAILVSRSYYEVVSRLSDDYARIFSNAGTRTDKHVREHSVYAIGKTSDSITARHLGSATTPSPAAGPLAGAAPSRASTHKYWLAGGIALAVALIGIGMQSSHDVAASKPVEKASGSSATTANAVSSRSAAVARTRESKPALITQMQMAKPMKSSVLLAIKPWGEIYVDGKKKGISPPLKILSLMPGAHSIEVRNTTFPSFAKTVDVRPGAEIRIEHKF